MQVWKYEGCRTLSYYLKRRDCLQALARDLAVPEKAVVATVMKQIFEGLTVSISPNSANCTLTHCIALLLCVAGLDNWRCWSAWCRKACRPSFMVAAD